MRSNLLDSATSTYLTVARRAMLRQTKTRPKKVALVKSLLARCSAALAPASILASKRAWNHTRDLVSGGSSVRDAAPPLRRPRSRLRNRRDVSSRTLQRRRCVGLDPGIQTRKKSSGALQRSHNAHLAGEFAMGQ